MVLGHRYVRRDQGNCYPLETKLDALVTVSLIDFPGGDQHGEGVVRMYSSMSPSQRRRLLVE